MMRDDINNEYFNWLCKLVCRNLYSDRISYRKLLMHLHDTNFRYSILRDKDRAEDGLNLRYRFADEYTYIENADTYVYGPCSVLEMMVALAIRCEETIMDDTSYGDRTKQWFWNMITNLGLGSMNDNQYNRSFVTDIVETFLNREYEPDGRGGLFTIRDCDYDLRTMEIWNQLCWYLDSII